PLALFDRTLRPPVRASLALYSALLLVGMVATQTRAALVGLIAGGGLLIVLTWVSHPNRRARALTVIGATSAAAALGLVLLITPLGARVLGTVEISAAAESDESSGPRLEESAGGRLALYEIAVAMVRERPVFGFGPDNFAVGVPKYRTDS